MVSLPQTPERLIKHSLHFILTYINQTVFDKNKCDAFLAQFKLPKLSEEDALNLAKEIFFLFSHRLQIYMPLLVHRDQTGFIKSRLTSDNIRRLLHIISAARDIQAPAAVLSLDVMSI